MEDLGTIIFLVLLALVTLAGRKKKRPPIQKPAQPRPSVRVERSAPVEASSTTRREAAESRATLVKSAEERPEKTRGLAQELLEMLQERLEVPDQPPAPRPEPQVEVVPESLETLEPAGTESHERFHRLYMDDPPAERPYAEPEERKQRLKLSRERLQHAFIMKEIIGKPKGIE